MNKRTLPLEEANDQQFKKGKYQLVTTENEQKERTSSLQSPTMLLTGHSGAIYSVAFDKTGRNLASASFDSNICNSLYLSYRLSCTVLWNTYGDCNNYNVLSGHKNAVLEVQWETTTNNKIISCSADKTIGVWDASKGTRLRRLVSHTGIVNSCTLSSNSPDLFASGSDDCSALIWDTRNKLPIQTFWHEYQVTSVCLDHTGACLYTGGIDNIIRRWDLRMPSSNPDLTLAGHGNTITGLSLNPEGTHLLSNGMDSSLLGL